MTGLMRAPRTRGALSGFLLVLLGLWGGLVPFIGPYDHFAYTPDSPWVSSPGRWWLSVLPAVAVVFGGFVVLTGTNRLATVTGAWIAAVGGAWLDRKSVV